MNDDEIDNHSDEGQFYCDDETGKIYTENELEFLE